MLDRGDHALALDALDITHRDTRSQAGIFAKVFEVPPVHRHAVDVHARAEQEVHALRPRIAAQAGADLVRHLRIPGRRQGDAGRIGCGRAEISHSHRAVSHSKTGPSEAFIAADIEIIHAAEQIDLLFERHRAHDGVDAFVDARCYGRRSGGSRVQGD